MIFYLECNYSHVLIKVHKISNPLRFIHAFIISVLCALRLAWHLRLTIIRTLMSCNYFASNFRSKYQLNYLKIFMNIFIAKRQLLTIAIKFIITKKYLQIKLFFSQNWIDLVLIFFIQFFYLFFWEFKEIFIPILYMILTNNWVVECQGLKLNILEDLIIFALTSWSFVCLIIQKILWWILKKFPCGDDEDERDNMR